MTVVMIWMIYAGRAGAADHDDDATAGSSLVGTQLIYSVRYKSEGYAELPSGQMLAPGGDAPPKHSLLGSLDGVEILTFLGHDHKGDRASIRFEKAVVNIQVDSQSQPMREKEVAEILRHPVAIIFGAQSRITSIEVPKSYTTIARNFVKAIITLQQYAGP